MNANASRPALAGLAWALLAGAASAEGLKADLGAMCPSVYQPVCAMKAGEARSFGNSCLALREGFAVTSQGSCGAPAGLPLFCAKASAPVCGERNGEQRVFGNACAARAEDFAVVHDGNC